MHRYLPPTGRPGELRLGLLTAMGAAVHRRAEITATIEAAVDRDQAVTAVRALLGVDVTAANAVLSMTWDRSTIAGVRDLTSEIDGQAAALGISLRPHEVWVPPAPPG